jgi:hypothetical protein
MRDQEEQIQLMQPVQQKSREAQAAVRGIATEMDRVKVISYLYDLIPGRINRGCTTTNANIRQLQPL